MILLGFSSPSDRESINQTCLILLDYDLSIFFEQVIFQAVHSFASMTVLVVASMAVLEKSVSRLRVSSPHLTRLKKGIHPQTITEAYHRAKMDRLDIVSSLLILLLAAHKAEEVLDAVAQPVDPRLTCPPNSAGVSNWRVHMLTLQ